MLYYICRARKLTDEQRSALAAFLSVYKGTEGGIARLALSTVSNSNHPSVERAYRLLSDAWTEVSCVTSQLTPKPNNLSVHISLDIMLPEIDACVEYHRGWVVCEYMLTNASCFWVQHILPQQRLLADEAGWEGVLSYVKDEDVAERLRGRWSREQGRLTNGDINVERWAELKSEFDKVT